MLYRLRATIVPAALALGLPLAASAQEELAAGQDVPASEAGGGPMIADAQAISSADSTAASTEGPATGSEQKPEDMPADSAGASESAQAKHASGSRVLEEVVVTAQRREEALQDVPISVSAFSGEALDARGVVDMNDLTRITPGLNVSQQAGFTLIYIRGIGSNAFITADPSVAYYIDGVYIPASQGLGDSFSDVERVEVLKGPQGTLFGRNAVGGAINVITKAPSFTDKSGYIIEDYNFTYDQTSTSAYINIPLTDTLAASASAFYKTGEHWLKDATQDHGQPLDRDSERGARIKVRWAPIEDLEVNLVGYWNERLKAGSLVSVIVNPTLLGTLVGAGVGADADPRKPHDSAPVYSTKFNHLIAGNAVYNLGWFDVKAYASHQFFHMPDAGFDFDGTSHDYLFADTGNYGSQGNAYELQFASNRSSWGSEWLTWIGGLYSYKDKSGFSPVSFGALGLNLTGYTGNNTLVLPPALVSLLDSTLGLLGLSTPNGEISSFGYIGKKSNAIYGQATVNFTDWMALTLGARYTQESLRILFSKTTLNTDNESTITVINFQNGSDGTNHHQFNSLKPKVSLDFHPFSDDTLLYLSFQQAFKSANYNTVNIYAPPKYVKPEEMTAYEVGIKTSLFEGTTRVSAAAFDYSIDNLQVQYLSVLAGGVINLENAGSARIRGVDLDLVSELFPSTFDNLVLTMSGAYLDGWYTDYRNASGYPDNIGVLTKNNDFTGNQVERNPKWSGSVALNKTWDVPGGTFELGGDAYYSGKIFFSPSNSKESAQDAYVQLGARASYNYSAWNLRLTAYGINVNNADYALGKMQFDFGQFTTMAPLASYGVKLQWDF